MNVKNLFIFATILLSAYVCAGELVDDVYFWPYESNTESTFVVKKKQKKGTATQQQAKVRFIEDSNQSQQHPDTVRAIIKR